MTVLESVKQNRGTVLFNKASIEFAQSLLAPSEQLIWASTLFVARAPVHGPLDCENLSSSNADVHIVALTNRRIFRARDDGFTKDTFEIPLSRIQSVDSHFHSGMRALTRIRLENDMLVVGHAKVTIQSFLDQLTVARQNAEAYAPAPATPPVSGSAAASDSSQEQLRMLKQLYLDGILSAKEFADKAVQLL